MEILGPEPQALSNDEIISKYAGSLTELAKSTSDPQYDYERLCLISQARLQWLTVMGRDPALGWNQNSFGGDQVDWVAFDAAAGQNETGADVRLAQNVNYLGGDAWKFCAVMGSSSPRVKGVANDMRSPADIAAAHCADTNIRDLWTKNRIDRQWKIPAFHLYTTGPCFIRGFWNTDAVKYGESIEPKIEIVPGPDGMPMPQIVGEQPYANGDAEVSFHSVLEVSIPWEAKELRNNPLKLERMVNKWSLIKDFPDQLSQYRDTNVPDDEMSGASTAAAEARQATANPSGTAQVKKLNQWRFTEWWIPPHLYEAILSQSAREVIKTQFSRGLYLAKVGNVTVKIDEQDVCDEWTVCAVNRGEKIMERPICADNVPIVRAINDLFGMSIETVLRAITQTICDSQLIDRQAMSSKEAVPAEIILTALPVDGDISKRIFQIPPAHLSDQAIPLLDKFRMAGQDISGVRPELSGGGPPTTTYREAKQRRDQALAQLAPQAQSMRDAAEDLARILVNLRSKYGSGTVKAQRKGAYGVETDVVDMADLQEDGWHTESDDQFPMTLSDKRDTLYGLLHEFSPEVQAALSLLDPLNVDQLVEILQVAGFESATAEQKNKTLHDIDRLVKEEPIPGQIGPDGQPGPPMPSVPVDPFDNHQLVALIVSRWLIGATGQKHANTPGFSNVACFWREHNALAQPPMPPPEPPVKPSVALSLKLEDAPGLIDPIMAAAGINLPPKQATLPMPQQVPKPQMGSPAPINGPMPGNGIPPLPNSPQGPQPIPVQ